MLKVFEMEDFMDLKFQDEDIVNMEFKDCLFKNSAFEDCNLKNIYFRDCIFENCIIMNLRSDGNSLIQNMDFISCQIIGINWQDFLPNLIFMDPINKFEKSCLKYNTFFEMNLKKFDFRGNEIINSMFSSCELSESNFSDCKLDKTEFFKSDIRKANFKDARAYQIDVMTCKLKDAKFSTPEVLSLLNVFEIKID